MITERMAKRLQVLALSAPLTTPEDSIRAVVPRGPNGLAVLLSVNH